MAGALVVMGLHPLFNPAAYVGSTMGERGLSVEPSPATEDGAWITLCGPEELRPMRAIVQAVDPYLDVEVAGTDDRWSLVVVSQDSPAPELEEVAVTNFSTGTTFEFEQRRSLPITPV
jgi:hypothetical protein